MRSSLVNSEARLCATAASHSVQPLIAVIVDGRLSEIGSSLPRLSSPATAAHARTYVPKNVSREESSWVTTHVFALAETLVHPGIQSRCIYTRPMITRNLFDLGYRKR